MKEDLKEFYGRYKKYINLTIAGTVIYCLGYRHGYRTFKRVLIDACKIANENISVGGI